jgi:hypothetical protein
MRRVQEQTFKVDCFGLQRVAGATNGIRLKGLIGLDYWSASGSFAALRMTAKRATTTAETGNDYSRKRRQE